MSKLSKKMTLRQFDHGYWYATEIKRFAQSLGLPSANKLRKDELEKAIRHFLANGKVTSPTKRDLSKSSEGRNATCTEEHSGVSTPSPILLEETTDADETGRTLYV